MTDSPRRDGPEPTQPLGNSYPGYTDPAYASQASYGPTYQAPAAPAPTEQLPAYSPYGYDPYVTGQYGAQYPPEEPPQPPPPEGPKSPRWLWFVAGISVLMVIGLVIALVIVNSSRQQTVVAPLPSMTEPSFTTPTPTTSPRPTIPVFPLPTLPSTPSTTSPTVLNAGCHRNRGVRRLGRRSGHQHHLRRYRRCVADRVQRDAAVEQGGRAGPAGRGLRQRQHHQRRP